MYISNKINVFHTAFYFDTTITNQNRKFISQKIFKKLDLNALCVSFIQFMSSIDRSAYPSFYIYHNTLLAFNLCILYIFFNDPNGIKSAVFV